MPPLGRVLFPIPAGDRGVEPIEDVVVGAREIGVEREARSRLSEAPPGVGALHALGTEPRFRPPLILGAVGRLHGSDDVERSESGNVVGMDDLRMLDAVSELARLG